MIVRTDTETALLAAISKNPDEDDPRLRYSDWLEENGNSDRAEFIRVQCELASWNGKDEEHCPDCGEHWRWRVGIGYNESSDCEKGHRWSSITRIELVKREIALLAAHRDEWLRIDCPRCRDLRRGGMKITQCPKCGDGDGDFGRLTEITVHPWDANDNPFEAPTFPVNFVRGFPYSVTARLADVFERERLDPRLGIGPRLDQYTTPMGEWKPTALALRWLKHHPTLRRITISDFTPMHHTGSLRSGYSYVGGEPGITTPYALPNILFHEVGWDGSEPTDHSHGYLVWKTAEEVKDRVAKTAADVIRTHLEREPVQ